MAGARKLNTQSEAFWRDTYQVTEGDLDLVTGILLDTARPQPLSGLVAALITQRFQVERDDLLQQTRRGRIYRPQDTFEVGQDLTFSALDFAVGRVLALREGHNPKYGPFAVVRVAMQDGGEREFAGGLEGAHALNRPLEELLAGPDPDMTEEEMVRRFEHYVARRLEPALEAHEDFVRFADAWFLRALLPEVHIGYLNLAEAMIYEAGRALTAGEMLHDLGFEGTASEDARLFALNHALREDARFDNVSMGDVPVWYLHALEPAEVFNQPEVLKPAFRTVGGEYIGLTMLDLMDDIGDSLDDIETMVLHESRGLRYEVTFPLLHAGAMPATAQFLRLLPSASGDHFPITLTDAQGGQRFTGWVVPAERYVYGLGDWYTAVGMCVGGEVDIRPGEEPLTFALEIGVVRNSRSDWVRSAAVEADAFVLQMQRANVTVKCDREMLLDVPDAAQIVALMARLGEQRMPLHDAIRRAFAELAKLSGRGIVHAKSIYSVTNLLRRVGSVPVFADLTRNACFDPVGNGFWAYDASLEGTIYRTPVDMRERPQSTRDDLVKDQVVQYLGR